MKVLSILLLAYGLLFPFLKSNAQVPGEIIFYSNGSVFSPVIILEGDAQVLWTWDDNTTSNSSTPSKNYGTDQLRKNTLKVTPWSAVRRINIGYDAEDEGSPDIELVGNQFVSKVENLQLVAPYLREWCSSHNPLVSLDFSNFINLETIESVLSQTLQTVTLTNTPKLKRVAFVINGLTSLNLGQNPLLEQVIASANKFTDVTLPAQSDKIWSIIFRENPQLTNQRLFNVMANYPNISNLAVWSCNQSGDLVIPKTNPTRWVGIRAYDNQYTSLDLRGSLQNPNQAGLVDMHKNKLTNVNISGCHQIKTLDLSDNLLSSEMVEQVLKQLDEFGPTITPRKADLSKNSPITAQGKVYKANLEAKGWEVSVDYPTSANELSDAESFKVYPNPTRGKFHVQLNKVPSEGVMVEITNVLGQKLLEQKIYNNDSEWSVDQYHGKMFFVTIRGTNLLQTKRIIVD
ncbi:MAG TPA: T9SS type A sorting domain-containing protein [Ignavibacteriaceae bacterium]|nr:T9SS type A sorting domain-containing protein [Ignavibacteriaceae bacterium]